MCFFFQAEDGIRDVAVTGVQTCALPISMTKNNYLSALYRRIAARRGAKRAIMAVAHALLVIAYHMLKRKEDYRELGADHFDRREPNPPLFGTSGPQSDVRATRPE